VFHGTSQTFGLMTAAMGVGAVGGGLVAAAFGRTGMRPMVVSALGFGVVICLAAIAPTLPLELVALGAVGFASVTVLAMGNSTLQFATEPLMRRRVMALCAVAFLGSTPIGGPAIGWVTAIAGARVRLGVGALAGFAAAGLGVLAIRHLGDRAAGAPTAAA
jgi:hypothetical protein